MTPRLTAPEVSQLMRVTDRAVQALASAGRIPGAAKLGKCWT